MLESLLKTDRILSDLRRFVQNKAEGNPFYLEELVNSLIETETLIRDNGGWQVTRTITETDISSTINGVITGRLDRLDKETKRVLQEASVIGRAFLYEILKRITALKHDIDGFLRGLEQLDIIRTRSLQPDLEYMFKHSLTQEFGNEIFETMSYASLGVVSIVKGHMSQGLKMIEEGIRLSKENENKWFLSMCELFLGRVYLQIVQREGEQGLSTMFRNICFLVKNVPFAPKKAEDHFNKGIETAKEIGAKGFQAAACLGLGHLYKAKKRADQARQCMTEAVQLYEQCEAEASLKRAKEALAALGYG